MHHENERVGTSARTDSSVNPAGAVGQQTPDLNGLNDGNIVSRGKIATMVVRIEAPIQKYEIPQILSRYGGKWVRQQGACDRSLGYTKVQILGQEQPQCITHCTGVEKINIMYYPKST